MIRKVAKAIELLFYLVVLCVIYLLGVLVIDYTIINNLTNSFIAMGLSMIAILMLSWEFRDIDFFEKY